jgi:SAM-dependent methyltransferase
LAKEFGFQVSGLDYSERGCALASEILSAERVAGRVFPADLFSPPKELLGAFDVVVSFGVVEHFSPTEECLRALRRYLKPAGRLVSVVPNLSGLMGTLQYFLDREVREKHVIIDRESLVIAHERASLRPLSCEYQIFLNLGVLNAERWKEYSSLYWLIERVRSAGSKLAWLAESHTGLGKPNFWTSPYIFCLAERDT